MPHGLKVGFRETDRRDFSKVSVEMFPLLSHPTGEQKAVTRERKN
jgi:hypothetical protein